MCVCVCVCVFVMFVRYKDTELCHKERRGRLESIEEGVCRDAGMTTEVVRQAVSRTVHWPTSGRSSHHITAA